MIELAWGGADAPETNRMLGEWAGAILGHRVAEPYTTLGVIDGDDLIAVVVFHNFSRRFGRIELTTASTTPRWLARRVLREMFAYPFDQLGCQVVALRVSERNTNMLRIAGRFGFKGYLIPRLRGRDEGEVVLTLTDDDWRTNGYHGR